MKVQNDVSVKVPIGKYLVTFIMTTCVVWFVIGIWSLSLDAQNPILIIEALMYIIPIVVYMQIIIKNHSLRGCASCKRK